jgi:DeoR/GlpR family transcriptional regulator of sugar metabolism
MIASAKEITVVADSSKLGRRSVSRIGSIDQIHRLITDTKAPDEFVKTLRARGVEVVLA